MILIDPTNRLVICFDKAINSLVLNQENIEALAKFYKLDVMSVNIR